MSIELPKSTAVIISRDASHYLLMLKDAEFFVQLSGIRVRAGNRDERFSESAAVSR
jgi:hypothetical protein